MLSWLRRKAHSARVYLLGGLLGVLGGVGGCGASPELNFSTSKTTNKAGSTSFEDSTTGETVVVKVVDENGKPRSGIEVIFSDGDGFEVFYARDPKKEYLPVRYIFPHNSEHVLKTWKDDGEIHLVQKFGSEEDQKVLYRWQNERGTSWTEHTYQRTIDDSERMQMNERAEKIVDLLWKGIVWTYTLGASSETGIKPSDLVNAAVALQGEGPRYTRWDYYTYQGSELGTGRDAGLNITLVPSNIPSLDLQVDIIDGRVDIAFTGYDQEAYTVEKPEYFPGLFDVTILLGQTPRPDLVYSYGVFSEIAMGDLSYGNTVSIPFGKKGQYSLEARVRDEVGNTYSTTRPIEITSVCESGGQRLCNGTISEAYDTCGKVIRRQDCTNLFPNAPDIDTSDYICVDGECVKRQQTPQARCTSDGDCITDYCKNGVCAQPINYENCHDQRKNAGESDVDCGHVCPTKCDLEEFCLTAADCVTNYCNFGMCETPRQPEPEERICGTYRFDGTIDRMVNCEDESLVNQQRTIDYHIEIDGNRVTATDSLGWNFTGTYNPQTKEIVFRSPRQRVSVDIPNTDCTVEAEVRFEGTVVNPGRMVGSVYVSAQNPQGADCPFVTNVNGCEIRVGGAGNRIEGCD